MECMFKHLFLLSLLALSSCAKTKSTNKIGTPNGSMQIAYIDSSQEIKELNEQFITQDRTYQSLRYTEYDLKDNSDLSFTMVNSTHYFTFNLKLDKKKNALKNGLTNVTCGTESEDCKLNDFYFTEKNKQDKLGNIVLGSVLAGLGQYHPRTSVLSCTISLNQPSLSQLFRTENCTYTDGKAVPKEDCNASTVSMVTYNKNETKTALSITCSNKEKNVFHGTFTFGADAP